MYFMLFLWVHFHYATDVFTKQGNVLMAGVGAVKYGAGIGKVKKCFQVIE